ncbi:uncharacterized protein F5Z01DRAFT_655303 [Emericellopsis atlantica]|uniref:Uncharacterized protein n=1 Tax=Emericellopsis atlantica TaxID=2614577 RepID=A0A9P8CPE3_9HYPO|nr:uncharacterized protein F5Z01DRAFT_655303 [Emericellopsis atlantica]KAG9254428.1 hypothetical protein F5Z01DRAFT_655303 [Emericellopsis atlantica]
MPSFEMILWHILNGIYKQYNDEETLQIPSPVKPTNSRAISTPGGSEEAANQKDWNSSVILALEASWEYMKKLAAELKKRDVDFIGIVQERILFAFGETVPGSLWEKKPRAVAPSGKGGQVQTGKTPRGPVAILRLLLNESRRRQTHPQAARTTHGQRLRLNQHRQVTANAAIPPRGTQFQREIACKCRQLNCRKLWLFRQPWRGLQQIPRW